MTQSTTIANLLANPFVLRCAWHKLEAWYSTVEWTPEPEWSEWCRDPWPHLVEVARELAEGRFQPSNMIQIPYPKQGCEIRHYVLPSVRDQLAHLIFAVLLAPFIEARLPNVNFGSRWYRELRRVYVGGKPSWEQKPFSLGDSKLYLPYQRDYGLYRRLASWIAERLTGGSFRIAGESEQEAGISRNEFPRSMLPYVDTSSFKMFRREDDRACYARLDLVKAFPSMHRHSVRQALVSLVKESLPSTAPTSAKRWNIAENLNSEQVGLPRLPDESTKNTLENPWHILAGKAGESLRLKLARKWMDLLDLATFESMGGGQDIHSVLTEIAPLREKDACSFGLPTGLAVSPMLMNVALSKFDYAVLRSLEAGAENGVLTGAYLRFADDMVVFGKDPETLGATITEMEGALRAYRAYSRKLRPRLNWDKAKPESIRKWGKRRKRQAAPILSKNDWIDEHSPGEFVTYLVECMSNLGVEIITERRGEPAFSRLARLHELARWDIRDLEVRKDTLLAFAANRLATAWVPLPDGEDQELKDDGTELQGGRKKSSYEEAVADIRRSIRQSVLSAPFKFGLWHSVILAMLRTEHQSETSDEGAVRTETGIDWLQKMLRLVAIDSDWEKAWPSSDSSVDSAKRGSAEDPRMRRACVSFLRSHFWRELAKIIRQLDAACEAGMDRNPPSDAWYARVIGPRDATPVLRLLSETSVWARILYPSGTHHLPAWERTAIKLALSACLDASRPGSGNSQPGYHKHLQMLLGTDLPGEQPLASFCEFGDERQALSRCERVQLLLSRPKRFAPTEALTILEDAVQSTAARLKLSDRKSATVHAEFMWGLNDYAVLRRALIAFECDTTLGQPLLKSIGGFLGGCKGVNVPQVGDAGGRSSLIRLLWGAPSTEPLANWLVRPTRVPAVGLPVPWAIKIYHDLLKERVPVGQWRGIEPVIETPWEGSIAEHRRLTLGDSFRREPGAPLVEKVSTPVVAWEERLTILPHPTNLVPKWLGWSDNRAKGWHATLAFFLALDGGERFHDRAWSLYPNMPSWGEHLERCCETPLPSFVWSIVDYTMGYFQPKLKPEAAWKRLQSIALDSRLMASGFKEYATSISIEYDNPFPCTDKSYYLCPHGSSIKESVPPTLEVSIPRTPKLAETLRVRIAQVSAEPDWERVPEQWPAPAHVCREARNQLIHAIESVRSASPSYPSEMLVFPELVLHADDVDDICRLAKYKGIGLLGGLFWREVLPPILPAYEIVDPSHVRYFVNEAVLMVPHIREPRKSPPFVFRIRKPRPAHIEYGVQDMLTKQPHPKNTWRVLRGSEWIRFDHHRWGPFAVAICSDLLDAEPWTQLRGSLLHLFLTAWNPDINLYDSMTWSRAYELFANVVSVNHGHEGGSRAWIPIHTSRKTAFAQSPFSVQGRGHFVMTDVDLPVRALYDVQRLDEEAARQQVHDLAKEAFSGSSAIEPLTAKHFKTPGPTFRPQD